MQVATLVSGTVHESRQGAATEIHQYQISVISLNLRKRSIGNYDTACSRQVCLTGRQAQHHFQGTHNGQGNSVSQGFPQGGVSVSKARDVRIREEVAVELAQKDDKGAGNGDRGIS